MVAALEADVVSLTDAEEATVSDAELESATERQHRGCARSRLPRPGAGYRHRNGGGCDARGRRGRAGGRPAPRHGRRDRSAGPGPEAGVASLVPLRVVPQCPARRGRPGARGRGGRGHERPARVLGRARHHVGPPLERPRDRRHRSPRHRGHHRGIHCGVRDHDRLGRPCGLPLGAVADRGPALGHGPVDDLVRGRAGSLHPGRDHPLQHHSADRVEGRSDAD